MTKHQYRDLKEFLKELKTVNVETVGLDIIRDEKAVEVRNGNNIELKTSVLAAIRITSAKKYADVPDVDFYLLDDIVINQSGLDAKEYAKVKDTMEARLDELSKLLGANLENVRLFRGQSLP